MCSYLSSDRKYTMSLEEMNNHLNCRYGLKEYAELFPIGSHHNLNTNIEVLNQDNRTKFSLLNTFKWSHFVPILSTGYFCWVFLFYFESHHTSRLSRHLQHLTYLECHTSLIWSSVLTADGTCTYLDDYKVLPVLYVIKLPGKHCLTSTSTYTRPLLTLQIIRTHFPFRSKA